VLVVSLLQLSAEHLHATLHHACAELVRMSVLCLYRVLLVSMMRMKRG
jgi:hypothetical protein